jgi:hypothetical protein
MKVLHLSPHPDDELLGAGGTLLSLRDAGHEITNLACSLGREHEVRLVELEEACRRSEFELLVSSAPYRSARHDQGRSEAIWRREVERIISDFDLLIAPFPHDFHPAHEAVGRVAAQVCLQHGITTWFWGLWTDLPFPNLMVPIPGNTLNEVIGNLVAHQSQLERNDYRKLVEGRALSNAILGPEKLYGFGHQGGKYHYAELLVEAVPEADRIMLPPGRIFSSGNPLSRPAGGHDISEVIFTRSIQDKLLIHR